MDLRALIGAFFVQRHGLQENFPHPVEYSRMSLFIYFFKLNKKKFSKSE